MDLRRTKERCRDSEWYWVRTRPGPSLRVFEQSSSVEVYFRGREYDERATSELREGIVD